MEHIRCVDIAVHSARNVRRLKGECKCAVNLNVGASSRTGPYVKGDDILVEFGDDTFALPYYHASATICEISLVCKPSGRLRSSKVVASAQVPLGEIYEAEVKENGVTEDGVSTARTPARWYPLRKAKTDTTYSGEVLLSFRFDVKAPTSVHTPYVKAKTLARLSTRIGDALKKSKSTDRLGGSIEEGIISAKPFLGNEGLDLDTGEDGESKDFSAGCSSKDKLTDSDVENERPPIRETSVPPWVRNLCKLSPKEGERRADTLPRRPPTEWSTGRQHDEAVLDTLTRDALLALVKEQRHRLMRLEAKCSDLEDYIDALLARVMDSKPDILAHHPKIGTLRFH